MKKMKKIIKRKKMRKSKMQLNTVMSNPLESKQGKSKTISEQLQEQSDSKLINNQAKNLIVSDSKSQNIISTSNISSSNKSTQIIEQYPLTSEQMTIQVKILQKGLYGKEYHLVYPVFSEPTNAYLDEIKKEIISEVSISEHEIMDVNIIKKLKERVRIKLDEMIKKDIPDNSSSQNFLIGTLIHSMLGLGNVEFLLNDPNLEEIRVNSSKEPTWVYHKNHGWLRSNVVLVSEAESKNFADIMARRVGKQVNVLNPLLDAHLITGDRVNVVLYPVSTKGNTITIRKFARDPWTVTDFIKNNTVSSEIMALIWLALEYEMNILVSGGTGSGKTSFLNICMPFFPPNHSIISIEDTRELQLPEHLYWTPLVTRLPSAGGKGEITMLDLLINSLRMRPDRIIMGEIRKERDAQVLFEAMHTGHSVYTTLHANSMTETISRITNPPISIPKNLLSSVDLNVVMFRDRKRGIRRLFQIGELLVEGEGDEATIRTNILYRWKPSTDTFVERVQSVKLFEDISRHTGFTRKEVAADLDLRKKILDYMVKNNLRSITEVGNIMKTYYYDKESLVKAVLKNLPASKALNL